MLYLFGFFNTVDMETPLFATPMGDIKHLGPVLFCCLLSPC